MRTRFLNTDYFASSSSPIETLSFPNFAVPHLPPSRLFNYFDSPVDVSFVIETLLIDLALCKLLAEVIPQPVEVRYGDFEADRFLDNEVSADSEGRVESRFYKESACFYEKEEMHMFFEVLEIEHNVDMFVPGLTTQYSNKVQGSVYSVEDVLVECPMEQTANVSEDASSVLDKTQYHLSTFPL
ncbi:hypothetical protein HS088_TW18G01048 [Tripterygium wilfordii]|uniref:Uncharacterized protein n=1 Tax=Tripterygium wilfordii TaxID=458696 RepID=A0A7J7CDV2_TRIWF|nr:hypothetical protein HS088_TW18G01048 [Tripterygium wilfordii]